MAETVRGLRGEREGYFYTRSSNPTTRQLERILADMQGREDAVVCASGVGAIAQALLSLLQQDDHVLCFVETYGPTRALIRRTLKRFGVSHTMLSIEDDAGIEQRPGHHADQAGDVREPDQPGHEDCRYRSYYARCAASWRTDDSRQYPGGAPSARQL